MNTYIPKQIRKERERVEAKLDRDLIQRLELYCRYLESDRDYVIANALQIAFRKDKGFAEWIKSQPATEPVAANPSHSEPQGARNRRAPARELGEI